MTIKKIQQTWLTGRLTKIIKKLYGLDIEVVFEEATTEMAYTTATTTWLTFNWANGSRKLWLTGENARWADKSRQFNFSTSEKVLHKVARDIGEHNHWVELNKPTLTA